MNTSNEQIKDKIKKNNSIHNSIKMYLGINLIKEMQDLHAENYETFLKERHK